MKINFAIIFIIITTIPLLYIISVLLITDYKKRYLIFSKSLCKNTIVFLLGYIVLLYQFSLYHTTIYVKYPVINFVFNLPVIIIFLLLICSFLVFFIFFCDFIFKVEEIITIVAFSFIIIYAISARDLFSMFVCLEGANICLFIFLLSSSNNITSAESAIKYIFISMLSSLFMVMGILFIYINWAVFAYADIELLIRYAITCPFAESAFGFFGVLLIIFAFFIKLGIFPFYGWVVNVYKGLSPVGLVFATVLSKTTTLILFVIFLYYIKTIPLLSFFLIPFAVGSLFVATIFLFYTESLREFIAFTSLASNGFLILFLTSILEASVVVSIFYIVIQAINLLFIFSLFCFLKTKTIFPNTFRQLRNYVEMNFLFFALFCFIIFSVLGIPPFAGFFPKILMMYNLFVSESYYILFVFVIFTLVSSFYFIRLFQFFSINTSSINNDQNPTLFLTRPFRKFYILILLFLFYNVIILYVFSLFFEIVYLLP